MIVLLFPKKSESAHGACGSARSLDWVTAGIAKFRVFRDRKRSETSEHHLDCHSGGSERSHPMHVSNLARSLVLKLQ